MSFARMEMLRLEIACSSPGELLAALSRRGVGVYDTVLRDEFTIQLSIKSADYNCVHELLERRGEVHRVVSRSGIAWFVKRLLRRPVLVSGVMIALMLTLFLPGRVLFVTVKGNDTLPDHIILAAAEQCGIHFGAARRNIRSERVKNYLLATVPQLQWAGVNTRGCVAEISVRERTAADKSDVTGSIRGIIASRDGIVRQMTVTAGNPVCVVGQAVKKGQLLVSGYTDCGISLRAEFAQAEIFADTRYVLEVVSPLQYKVRGNKMRIEEKYSLLIGKKLINFFKDSGILDISCVKMYDEYPLSLGGGLSLPISLVKQTVIRYDSVSGQVLPDEAFTWVSEEAGRYLLSTMTAGSITGQTSTVSSDGDAYYYTGNYDCLEMIGQSLDEVAILSDEQGN